MTLLVVVYENICGIFFFFLICRPFYFPHPQALLCVFLLRNKELEEILTIQSQLRWEEVGRENWGSDFFFFKKA